MPIGNTDFARDFQAGASVARMAQQRQERMIELRAQAAQQALAERQYAAQAQMLTEHARLYRIQADEQERQQKDEVALAKSLSLQHAINTQVDGMSEDESMQQLIPVATIANPVFGEKIAKGYGELKRANTAGLQQPTANMKDTANEMQLRRALQTARTPEERAAIQQELDSFMMRSVPSGETITTETDPATGKTTTTIQRGGTKKSEGMTTATRGEIEKKMQSSLTSLSMLQEAMGGMNPSTVGPAGIVNEQLETVKSWAKPGSPTDVTKARQTMRVAAQQQYSSLKADSQINKLEAAAMKDIADVTDWNISSDTGKQKYQTLLDLTGLQTVLRAKELGVKIPDRALAAMSAGQVARSWKRGELTDDDVQHWNDLVGAVK